MNEHEIRHIKAQRPIQLFKADKNKLWGAGSYQHREMTEMFYFLQPSSLRLYLWVLALWVLSVPTAQMPSALQICKKQPVWQGRGMTTECWSSHSQSGRIPPTFTHLITFIVYQISINSAKENQLTISSPFNVSFSSQQIQCLIKVTVRE